jgi:hypothetical protein
MTIITFAGLPRIMPQPSLVYSAAAGYKPTTAAGQPKILSTRAPTSTGVSAIEGLVGSLASLDLVTCKGNRIPYPFGDKKVENRDFFAHGRPRWSELRHDVDPDGTQLSQRLGKRLDRGRGYPTAQIYQLSPQQVAKFHPQTIKAERLLHLQRVLNHFKIPHLMLQADPVALKLAESYGIIIQERLPAGAKSLDEIASEHGASEFWKEVRAAVIDTYGPQVFRSLERINARLFDINQDQELVISCRRHGYIADQNAMVPNRRVIDELGNGGPWGQAYWSTNLYYHPKRGWFLLNW